MEDLSHIAPLLLAQLYGIIGDIEGLARGPQVSEKFTKSKGLESGLYWLITLCFLNIFWFSSRALKKFGRFYVEMSYEKLCDFYYQ